MTLFRILLTAFCLSGVLSCQTQSPSKMTEFECVSLIKRVTEIPLKHGIEVSGSYYTIFKRSAEKPIADCFVSQITNIEAVMLKTASPGPKPQFVVGDISVFMLTDMYDISYTSFIAKEDWANMGIFEYYKFTEQQDGRQTIQDVFRSIIDTKFAD